MMARMGYDVSGFKVLCGLRRQRTDGKWYEGRGEWLVLETSLREGEIG